MAIYEVEIRVPGHAVEHSAGTGDDSGTGGGAQSRAAQDQLSPHLSIFLGLKD